jgi:mono/diheme cytochrome c family protein
MQTNCSTTVLNRLKIEVTNMKQGRRNSFTKPRFLLLALTMVFLVGNVMGQSDMPSYWGMDRWDPGHSERDMWGSGMMGQGQQHRMQRHWAFMHSGIPPIYRGQHNPLPQTPEVVQAGGKLYQEQCSSCHGRQGLGDGLIAKSLNPSPALLAYMIQMPMSVDSYLLWSISEGGEEFGTSMPAFKNSISNEEIWQIVTYMRAGFPSSIQSN